MAKSSSADRCAPVTSSPGRPAPGRLRLLAVAEQLFATRGLGVPNHEIVTAAGQRNRSAIAYHFGSRAGLIEAVRERHEAPIAQHRQQLVARLPGTGDRSTRQLIEAYVQPLAAEMLRCTPSYWARLSEMLLADQPLRFSRGDEPLVSPQPQQRADTILAGLLRLMAAHLSHLPESEAADRVALTIQFASSGLARWERDSQASADSVAPLALFTLVLADLAVAMLDAPSSVPAADDAAGPRGRAQTAVQGIELVCGQPTCADMAASATLSAVSLMDIIGSEPYGGASNGAQRTQPDPGPCHQHQVR